MGIIEFHFHDPEFDFSPSMSTGGDTDDDGFSEETDDGGELVDDWETDGSGGVGAGALVALVVLVALAVLAGLKRRSGGGESTDDEELELDA